MKNAVRSWTSLRSKHFRASLSADSNKRSAYFPFLFMLLGMTLFSFQAIAQTKFWSSDIQNDDRFGYAVAQNSTDAIVGAPGEDEDGSNSGSAYVFTFNGTEYVQEDKLTAGADGDVNDKFGSAVDISGNYAIVGAPFENDKGFGTGVAYIFMRSAGVWSKVATLRPADLKKGHFFGFSVAISGDYALIGALGDDDQGSQAGAVYVYHLSGGVWSFSEKIYAGDAGPNDYFGFSVDIDGDYAVVGAHRNDDAGSNSGSAYVFHLSGGTFTQQQELNASDAMALDSFGYQVAISGDRVLVGAPGVDDNGSNAGAAYVFLRSGSTWSEEDKILASDGQADDYFGWSVSISGDAAFIGAWGDDDAGTNQGAAYSYARSGSSWLQQDKFTDGTFSSMQNLGFDVSIAGDYAIAGGKGDDQKGPNSGTAIFYKVNEGFTCLIASNGDSFDRLGQSVDIRGNWAIAGAHTDETSANLSSAGSAYIYMKSGVSWAEVQNITPSDPSAGARFGYRTGIYGDYAIVGAPFKDEGGLFAVGATYIFQNIAGTWTQIQKLSPPALKANEFFGYGVAIYDDYAVIGDLGNDDKGTQAGAAYVYQRIAGVYTLVDTLYATDANANDYFGQDVDIDHTDIIVSAPNKASKQGAAYVFTGSGASFSQQDKLLASDGAAADTFGWKVAIAPDYAIVGAPGKEAAYIYHRSGGTWSQQMKLTGSDAVAGDQYGWDIGITTERAVVGAYQHMHSGIRAGAVYVYNRSGSSWTETQELMFPTPTANDEFGRAVDIDENTVMVGSQKDNNANGNQAGAVCFFRLPSGSPMLVPVKELTALETIEGSAARDAEVNTISKISESNTVQPLDAVIYPNPSKGTVTIEFTMESATPATIQVMNMAGQVVYSAKNIQVEGFATERINLEHLTNGVYLVNINNGQEQIIRKLVLNK